MSGEFLKALDPTSFKSSLSRDGQSYVCACGLSIGVGVDNLDPGVSILRRPALLKAAHQRHHGNHFGTPATLYMIDGLTPTGQETLAAAQCSCEYDVENLRA